MNIYELHHKMTAHLFPSYSNTDVRFLTLAICGEAGELANMIKKRWRDSVDLTEQCCDEIADIRVYLELLAKCFDIEGSKLDQLTSGSFDFDGDKIDHDEHFLSLALCFHVGRLAGFIIDAWLVNEMGGDAGHARSCQNKIVDIRVALEFLAQEFGIGGELLDQRVEKKLAEVAEKHKARLKDWTRQTGDGLPGDML